ncbi:unnamed protein product, partial [marine sediment metagenome]
IASQLYQTADVSHNEFQKQIMPESFYDMVVTNVPFGTSQPYDTRHNAKNYRIHDYFINKGLNLLRPGGLGVFITSTGSMDKVLRRRIKQPGRTPDYFTEISPRNEFAKKADLIAAIRVPNGIYEGAQASSDILFFRKKGDNLADIEGHEFRKTDEVKMPEMNRHGVATGFGDITMRINKYWGKNPDNVLGRFGAFEARYGDKHEVWTFGNPDTLGEDMSKIISKFPTSVLAKPEAQE